MLFHKRHPPVGSRRVRERIHAGIGPLRSSGPDYLAYALIDTIIDGYWWGLKANDITIPFPQRDVHLSPGRGSRPPVD